MTHRIAIAQITMSWTTPENVASIRWAMELAQSHGAQICAFSELAITGFHRHVAREAVPETVGPAISEVGAHGARLSLSVAVGAPAFGDDGSVFISHVLLNERGQVAAVVPKRGLTAPEATFFQRGAGRPIGKMHGLRCSAVICREVEDLELVSAELAPGAVDLIFVPGALRQDPDKPRTDPPEYVRNIQRLARVTEAYVVQTNWPNALNRPEESAEGGGSTVAAPDGEVLFRLPGQAAGVGIFNLGERHFDWHPQ